MGALVRFLIGLPGAALVTVVLFLTMNYMTSQLPDLEEQRDAVQIDINASIPDVDVVADLADLERPVLDTPPPPPPATVDPTNRPSIDGVRAEIPQVEVELEIGSGFNPDRDAQPLVRIPPSYPERCQSRASSEEYVVLEFDVDPAGQPQNIRVIDASTTCFNRAAIRSVQRWKYQPKIVDNEAQWRRGVVTRVTFLLADE